MVKEAIESGMVSKTVNKARQERHTLKGHIPGRSYLNGDLDFAQELIDNLIGTGEPVVVAGQEWKHKERVTASKIIGTHVDP